MTLARKHADAISALVGEGEFSAFVDEAIAERLQHTRIDEWLSQREAGTLGEWLNHLSTESGQAHGRVVRDAKRRLADFDLFGRSRTACHTVLRGHVQKCMA